MRSHARSVVSRLLAIVLVAVGLGLFAAAPAHAESEPNNTMETANPIAVGSVGDTNAQINPDGDQDYYRFTAPKAGIYTAQVYDASVALQDIRLEVLDGSGNSVDGAGYDGSGNVAEVQTATIGVPGTYYLRVYPYYSTSSVGTYSVRILPDADAGFVRDSEAEPDGDIHLAPTIRVGHSNSVKRTLAARDADLIDYRDIDCFRLDLPEAGAYEFQIYDAAASLTRVELWIYTSSGHEQATTANSAANVANGRSTRISVPGTYFACAMPYYSDGAGTYSFRVLPDYENGLTWDSQDESDNGTHLSTSGVLSRTYSGTLLARNPDILSSADNDYRRVPTTTGTTYALTGSSSTDVYFRVLNTALDEVAEERCSEGETCDLSFTSALGGEYFIVTDAYYDSSSGPYQYCVRVAGASCSSGVDRLSGADRFATSAAISSSSFTPGVNTLFVASGRVFPDALSVAPVAGLAKGPVLLVDTTSIPSSIRPELTRLKPDRIVVVGGPATISDSVLSELRSFTSGPVTRWSGADRFATSASTSSNSFEAGEADVAYIASGLVFPDALSGGPVGTVTNGPILLTSTDSIPEVIATELRRLRPGKIVILGGPASVSESVRTQLGGFTDGSVTRWSGADRFETSAAISKATFDPGGTVFVASGRVFPDALSGAPAAGVAKAPVLLVDTTSIPSSIDTELRRLQPRRIVVLGGINTISESVASQLDNYVKR